MLSYTILFLIVALIAGALGFGALHDRVDGREMRQVGQVDADILASDAGAESVLGGRRPPPSEVPAGERVTGGCALGGLIGVLTARKLLDTSHLYRLRQRWFALHASQGLVLVALWPLAQIYPTSFLFGQGQVLPTLSGWLSDLLDMDIDLLAFVRPDPELTVEQYWLSETMITACGMVGGALDIGGRHIILAEGARIELRIFVADLRLGEEAQRLMITNGPHDFLIDVGFDELSAPIAVIGADETDDRDIV